MKPKGPYLECPKCGHEVWAFEDGYICSNPECDYTIEFEE